MKEGVNLKKIKVLEFFGEPLNYGGQEAFILNVYSKINKETFNFTFITPFECTNIKLQELINENNDTIVFDNYEFESNLRKKFILQTAKKYITNKYDIVHIHSGSVFTLFNVAKIAKKNGVKRVIVHSHATGKMNVKYKIIKFISDLSINKYADYFFACSGLAGKWKFPKKIINSKKYYIIKNGINLDKFRYDYEQRTAYRKEFQLENKLVIIHVGRFSAEKNQLYILDIFNELLKIKDNSVLFLVGGDGEFLEKVKHKIDELNLNNKVNILMNRSDVNNLINMSDVFILPSLWEGLPFTGIEAQANGIPCIFSDTITDELNISESYNKLSINEEPKIWATEIVKLAENGRRDTISDVKKNGFDIENVCNFLENVYGGNNEK